MVAAARATEVDSAIEALDFETEPPSKWLRRGSEGLALNWRRLPDAQIDPAPDVTLRIYHAAARLKGGYLPPLAAMTPTRVSIAAGGLAVLALLILGLVQLSGSSTAPATAPSRLTLAQMRARLVGSPAPLAALHAQAGELLPGGLPAVRARLAALRGRPVVINKWASWCQPCRAEFGAFQRASLAQGREVAFVGLDSGESNPADARAFLRSFPVSYPSFEDPGGQAGAAITESTFTPVTVFLDRRGRQYIHQGPYPSAAKLEQDVRRYALDA
jgi:cytochrome c biogenesis protein CcmG/thiol:disulfide interchange protein DsbE